MGLIQEQHPDRCRLFLQWKRMDFPILVDALNLSGARAVPLVWALDEHGVVRSKRPTSAWLASFVEQAFPAPAERALRPVSPAPIESLRAACREGGGAAWRVLGDALFVGSGGSGGSGDVGGAVEAYRRAVKADPEDARARFRLGVALRRRHEGVDREVGDFAAASAAWTRALALDPGQYIWRRRIEQYGPLLAKPYPFYDWVASARDEIRSRGEKPVALRVEPTGSELAGRRAPDSTPGSNETPPHPDPDGRLPKDDGTLVGVEATLVPAEATRGKAVRLHVRLAPAAGVRWNDEVNPPRAWLRRPASWNSSPAASAAPPAGRPGEREPRSMEFEVVVPEDARPEAVIEIAVFVDLCLDRDGTCLLRRIDVRVPVPLK